jgi:hypothetical protein
MILPGNKTFNHALRTFSHHVTLSPLAHTISSSMSRPIYLIVFHSLLFTAHWGLWMPYPNQVKIVGSTGKMINVQGNLNEGFHHEFLRQYDLKTDTRKYSTIFLCNVPSSMINDTDGADGMDDVPIDELDKAAVAIKAPGTSLRTATSVSNEETRLQRSA